MWCLRLALLGKSLLMAAGVQAPFASVKLANLSYLNPVVLVLQIVIKGFLAHSGQFGPGKVGQGGGGRGYIMSNSTSP